MIVASDDLAARHLYQVAGAEGLVRLGLGPLRHRRAGPGERPELLGPDPDHRPGHGALLRRGGRRLGRGPVAALRHGERHRATAADGFNQYFGLPSVASSWKVKQGWMCCLENLTRMHSTGFISGDRYTVALLIEGSRSVYGNSGAQTLTMMARALLPTGTIPVPAPPPPPPPDPEPTPTPTPDAGADATTDADADPHAHADAAVGACRSVKAPGRARIVRCVRRRRVPRRARPRAAGRVRAHPRPGAARWRRRPSRAPATGWPP